jgi:large subunit ribosomal protein L7e
MAPSNTDQVAVPETLLKKRRVNEKTREEKLAKAAEAKKVSFAFNQRREWKGSKRKALP